MVQTVQIYRSPTNVAPSALLPGVLSAELGTYTKLWIGSASGNRLLSSNDPADTGTSTYLPLTGGTLTGPLVLAADPSAALGAATKQYVDAQVATVPLANYLLLAGGTMTGPLVLYRDPVAPGEAATKQYVDTFSAYANGAFVAKSGSIMTGLLYLSGDPSGPTGAATKQYVDNTVAAASFLPIAGGTLTGALRMGSAIPVAPADRAYGSMLFAGEMVIDPSGSTGGHIGFNTYLATGPVWKYRAAGYGGQIWQHTDGSLRLVVQASGSAGSAIGANVGTMALLQSAVLQNNGRIVSAVAGNAAVACWSTSAGFAYGMWCGGNSLLFGQTDASGLPTVNRMTLDGSSNLIVNGALYVGNSAVGTTSYLSADGSYSVWNFQANYALAFRKSDGLLYYNSPSAAGNMAFNCSPAGNMSVANNFTANGSVQGVNIIGTNACFPSYNNSTDFYLSADGTNCHLRWAGGWELYYQRSSGSMFYQRSGTNWFNWRAPDAVTYNGIANQGGIGPYADYSDVRGKTNIEDHHGGLDHVHQLRPVSFMRIPRADNLPPPRREIGFVAQELRDVIPEAVMPFEDLDSEEPGLAITTTAIVATLVNAVKELSARVAALEN